MGDEPETDEMGVGHIAERATETVDETDDGGVGSISLDFDGREFSLGVRAGLSVVREAAIDEVGCGGRHCGVANGDTEKVPLATDPDRGTLGDFNEELRALMEFYFPQIDSDTLVSRIEVCADDAPVAYIQQ